MAKKKRPGMAYRLPVASDNVWEKAERLLEGLRSDEEGMRLRQRAERATLLIGAEDREALQWLLDAGGSMPLAEFAARYEMDPEAPPNYCHPDSVLDRLRVHGMVTETAPGGEPFVAIPADLREPLRHRLAQMSEGGAPWQPVRPDAKGMMQPDRRG